MVSIIFNLYLLVFYVLQVQNEKHENDMLFKMFFFAFRIRKSEPVACKLQIYKKLEINIHKVGQRGCKSPS